MIDINKKYKTHDGHEVRIYALDGGGYWPVHGAMKSDNGLGWLSATWERNGQHHVEGYSLVEVKPRIKRKVYLNVWNHNVSAYFSKDSADKNGQFRIACVEIDIDVEEGHGL